MSQQRMIRIDINKNTVGKDFKQPIVVELKGLGSLQTSGATIQKGQLCVVEKEDFVKWQFIGYFTQRNGVLDTDTTPKSQLVGLPLVENNKPVLTRSTMPNQSTVVDNKEPVVTTPAVVDNKEPVVTTPAVVDNKEPEKENKVEDNKEPEKENKVEDNNKKEQTKPELPIPPQPGVDTAVQKFGRKTN